jgi:hypothetical protein
MTLPSPPQTTGVVPPVGRPEALVRVPLPAERAMKSAIVMVRPVLSWPMAVNDGAVTSPAPPDVAHKPFPGMRINRSPVESLTKVETESPRVDPSRLTGSPTTVALAVEEAVAA